MSFCRICGAPMKEGQRFCPHCGAVIRRPEEGQYYQEDMPDGNIPAQPAYQNDYREQNPFADRPGASGSNGNGNGNGKLIAVIVGLIALIVVCGLLIAYLLFGKNLPFGPGSKNQEASGEETSLAGDQMSGSDGTGIADSGSSQVGSAASTGALAGMESKVKEEDLYLLERVPELSDGFVTESLEIVDIVEERIMGGTYPYTIYTMKLGDTTSRYAISSQTGLVLKEVDGAFSAAKSGTDYILPESGSRNYVKDELEILSDEDLKLARNEIYARYGRRFQDETLQAYFDSKDWYLPRYEPQEFDDMFESLINDYERDNSDLIQEIEAERK